MAITSLAPQSSSVRCAICARPARRGATLCAQCKAAVKRARQVPSVHSEWLPHPGVATDRGPVPQFGDPRVSPGPRLKARPVSRGVPGGWGTYATLIAFGVAVCLTGYFALGELDDAANMSLAMHSIPATTAVPSSPAQSRPPLPSLAVDDTVRAESAYPADATDAQPSSAAPGPDKRPTSKLAQENQPLPGFDPNYAVAEPIAPPPVAREVVAAPPPVAEAPEPVADRWQLLASAMSRCERENPIAGLLCKERARLQHCEGFWGTAPQCPAVTAGNTR